MERSVAAPIMQGKLLKSNFIYLKTAKKAANLRFHWMSNNIKTFSFHGIFASWPLWPGAVCLDPCGDSAIRPLYRLTDIAHKAFKPKYRGIHFFNYISFLLSDMGIITSICLSLCLSVSLWTGLFYWPLVVFFCSTPGVGVNPLVLTVSL